MKNKTFITILGFSIYLMIYITFALLNTDSCTQGSIDFYIYTAIKLFILLPFLICYEFYNSKIIRDKIVIFNILKVVGICISSIKSLPYIFYTTIRGITICQGSTEWGGFSNKYGFENIQMVRNIVERLLPVCYFIVTLIFLTLLFIENKNTDENLNKMRQTQ